MLTYYIYLYTKNLKIKKFFKNKHFLATKFFKKSNNKVFKHFKLNNNTKNNTILEFYSLNKLLLNKHLTFFFINFISNKKLIFSDKNISYSWLIFNFLKSISKSLLGFSTNWIFINPKNLVNNELFNRVFKKLYNKRILKRFYCNKTTFLNWFVQLTYFKDPRTLAKFIKKFLLHSHLKKHKRFFTFVKFFLKAWYFNIKRFKKIKGFSLYFKGKLGRKGSVRKNKYYTKIGLVSFTNKNLRVNYYSYIVWTHTGSIGANISFFYKRCLH